jgi:Aerotolerance regulator N-terminal/von Willebrand factor type A domain
MTWLFPLYLLGGAAIIGPILMHLRRRPPQERVEFSSLMFLDAQTPMPVSKRRLENWLLLLLRCLALLLLALMFSRPLWRVENEASLSQNQATVLLIDRSASMQRGDLWKQAVAAATQRLEKSAITDRFALATMDRETTLLWTFDQDKTSANTRLASLKQQLSALKPGWAATDLGKGLADAAGWLASTQGMSGLKKRIIVITDLQEGVHLEALRGMVWPENIAVEIVRVTAPNSDNFTLSLAANTTDSLPGQSDAPTTRVRLSNARDSKVTDFKLTWDKVADPPITGYLPPGASLTRSVQVGALAKARSSDDTPDLALASKPTVGALAKARSSDDTPDLALASKPTVGALAKARSPDSTPDLALASKPTSLSISGDAWDFDNRIYIAPAQPKSVKIVFIGDEKTRSEAASPLYYLSRALQPTASLLPELSIVPESAQSLPSDAQLVFISGARLSAALAKAVRALAERGGLVVSVVTAEMTSQDLAALTGISGIQSDVSDKSDQYRMLTDVQTTHPLLRPFADERLRDFTKLRFWKHRKLTLPKDSSLEILARFDDGTPAILAQGKLILLTSGWHPADSQLALSTKFVPLLYGWLEAAGFSNEQATSLFIGDVISHEATTIKTPDGQTLTPKPKDIVRAEMPGIYALGKDQQIAVNLSPEEGRVTPMDISKLRELGVRVEDDQAPSAVIAKAEDKERLAITEQEAQQRAWIWLLGALLAILAWETWLAGRIRQAQPQSTFTPA